MNNKTQLGGLHHVTAITSDVVKMYDFFTKILGMRFIKKNVNQDDLKAYHIYFADDRGNAGTDMTFFDFKGIGKHRKGNNDISMTTFRVPSDLALEYYLKRFSKYEISNKGISTLFDKKMIEFTDFDGQAYALISDEGNKGVASGTPWKKGPVPDEFAITGLGPTFLRVDNYGLMDELLTRHMMMRFVKKENNYYLYEMGEGGNGASVVVEVNLILPNATQGYGGVHHVAFRVKDKQELIKWINYFNQKGMRNSGYVERFYFGSLYIRLYPNILFEIATDGPGFIDDEESYENLGEKLTLPPHLRKHREYIETQLAPFDTTRNNKFEKEYL